MEIKHVLASAKDKKCTILASEIKKNFKRDNEFIIVIYKDYDYITTYHKSRNGSTYYCDEKFIDNMPMPKIGEPVYFDIDLIEIKDKRYNYFPKMDLTNEFEPIRIWAKEKGIFEKGNPTTQFAKLIEETGELAKSILKQDEKEFIDAIGDCVVVLTNLAKLKGYNIEDCINSAYSVIAKRTGKMENGTFVKDK
jgi:NTP pyrophosphatase (non-canonical NTP hydrolase)